MWDMPGEMPFGDRSTGSLRCAKVEIQEIDGQITAVLVEALFWVTPGFDPF